MDNTFFELIISKVEEYVKPLGFESAGEGSFKKEGLTFKVRYSEESKSFVLGCTESASEDDVTAEEKNLSVWLFDETHRRKDAEVIAEDFCDCIRIKLGIEKARPVVSAESVSIPTRSKKDGDTLSMEQFVQRFLSVYPQYKDEYKNNVSSYGEFLALEFFKKCGIEKMRELSQSGTKKQQEKMMALLNEFYCQGDKALGDTIIAVFFGGAFCKEPELFKTLEESLSEYPFLKTASTEVVAAASKNKKFKEIF